MAKTLIFKKKNAHLSLFPNYQKIQSMKTPYIY